MRPLLAGIIGLWLLVSPAAASPGWQVERDIAYVPAGDERQTLDVYRPERAVEPLPTLLLVHGGGYLFGDKRTMGSAARYYTTQGYAVVAPNYRLAPDHPYPAPLEDVFCALAWVVTQGAQYGLDATRIVVIGESAGANAAGMLAVVETPARYLTGCPHTLPADLRLRGAVLFYPPADLSTCACPMAKSMAAVYLGLPPDAFDRALANESALRQRWQTASLLTWIDGSEPPLLLVHGAADQLIPPSESALLQAELQRVGVMVERLLLADAGHGFFGRMGHPATRRALPQVAAFLRTVMDQSAGRRP